MNQVQLIGRMAREPELRRTEKGTPVVSFALAVDRRFQRDTVDFVDCSDTPQKKGGETHGSE